MSTKKLAKELGLLRQRSQSSNGSKKALVSNQIFSYLIVIDFESTCWREKNNYTQEIIEFPGVLLNTSTGEVESEFHTYVQPQEHPTLSEFCTELTGITQMQVEAGIPLQICLSQFSRWLQNLQLNMGVVFSNNLQRSSASQKLCTFLTWSDWDLGVCLQYECKRKQLPKPDVLNSWIDLRSTYKLFYDRKPKGLNGALQDLGIQFAGREHSGLDDARNTAQLAARMMRDGCVMKITRSLTRTPLMVKPMLANTAADKKGKPNTDKGGNTTAASKSSFSTSCQMKLFSELFTRDLDKNKNSGPNCQSLVSPKTLLSGSSMLLGGKSLSTEVVTNVTSPIMRNCHSSHGNNSLVLCSTIAAGLFNQLSKTGAAVEEEFTEIFSVETEDRRGSYDDVVLEGHDEVIGVSERESHYDYVSDFDSGSYLCEEPESIGSTGFQVTLWDNMRVNNSKPKKMTKDSAMVSLPTKAMTCHSNIHNGLNETRQQSTITQSSTSLVRDSAMTSLPTKTMTCRGNVHNGSNETRQQSTITQSSTSLVVPQTVTLTFKLNQQKIGLKPSVKVHKETNSPHKNTKTNTQFMFEKTSTRNSSFAKPEAVVTQCKQIPKTSFSIYTDPEKSSHPSSTRSVYLSKQVLTSLSTNTLPSCTSGSVKREQRITSPLCSCGRRAKRQVVSNGGPNHGRGFYCCPVRRCKSGGRVQKGCEFFKWESALIKSGSVASPAVGSSVSLCQINSSVNCRPPQRSMIRKSY